VETLATATFTFVGIGKLGTVGTALVGIGTCTLTLIYYKLHASPVDTIIAWSSKEKLV